MTRTDSTGPAWANGDAELLLERLGGPLSGGERSAAEANLARVIGHDVPILPVAYRVSVLPIAAGVRGPLPRSGFNERPWIAFNAQEWNVDDPPAGGGT